MVVVSNPPDNIQAALSGNMPLARAVRAFVTALPLAFVPVTMFSGLLRAVRVGRVPRGVFLRKKAARHVVFVAGVSLTYVVVFGVLLCCVR